MSDTECRGNTHAFGGADGKDHRISRVGSLRKGYNPDLPQQPESVQWATCRVLRA